MSDLTVSRIEQLSGPRGATVAFGGTPKSPLAIQALTDAVARI